MIYLHKILPIFLLPIMLVLEAILIGLIKKKKKLIYISITALYILSTPIFSNTFFALVEGNDRNQLNALDNAEAIVVLSGMLEINEIGDSTYVEWEDPDRFFGGIFLFKSGKAPKLVFTGGKIFLSKDKKTEGQIIKEYAITNGIPTKKILVTKDVENTSEEATAVRELLSKNKKIILVTSAYHMYRAKMLFEKQGFIVIPYKVDYKVSRNLRVTLIDLLPSANNLSLTETGIRELMGRLYYLIR